MRFYGLHNKSNKVKATKMTFLRNSAFGLLVLAACQPGFVMAEGEKPIPHICAPDTIPFNPKSVEEGKTVAEAPIDLEADQIETADKNTVVLTGNAQAIQGSRSIHANKIKYSKTTDELEAEGTVVIRTPNGNRIKTTDLKIQLETFIGDTGPVEFKMAGEGGLLGLNSVEKKNDEQPEAEESLGGSGQVSIFGRGTADKARIEGHDLFRLENASYTTCKEGQDDIFVVANELELNNATGIGTARGVKIRFKKVPIFYWPYLTFSINNERKSGFLFPGFGSKPDSGFVADIPYYWNIAPQMDATITPRYLAKRGVQLEGEYRYLGKNFRGIIEGEFLPSDDQRDDKDRSAFSYVHQQAFSPKWSGDIKLQHVSDDDYFDDFETKLNISSSTHLQQRGRARYAGDLWRFDARLTAYQTVDDSISSVSKPYERLPQLLLSAHPAISALGYQWGLDSELVYFDHDVNVKGTRLDLTPSIAYPMTKSYGGLTPKLSIRHTSYDLKNQAAGLDDSPNRTLPIFSIDGGLVFERNSSWGGQYHTHTLEPRLFYVYIPHENQSDLPNFDTGTVSQNNFSNIFRENRFFGADRVGDTHQITLGVTSRLLSDGGDERMRASIGQLFYFKDRKVTTGADSLDTDSTSDFLAEIEAQFSQSWSTYGFLQWDIEDSETQEGRAVLRYAAESGRKANLAYRFSRDRSEQLEFDFGWPLANRWFVTFEDRYSLRDNENLATTATIAYNKCCWGIQIEAQRRRKSNTENINSIFFIFEFTGIARVRAGL